MRGLALAGIRAVQHVSFSQKVKRSNERNNIKRREVLSSTTRKSELIDREIDGCRPARYTNTRVRGVTRIRALGRDT